MYYIDSFVTTEELISINNTQTNWNIRDYVRYYATLGNESYIRLEILATKFKEFPMRVIVASVTGERTRESKIKNGQIVVSDEDFERAEKTLEYMQDIKDNIKVRITSIVTFFSLLIKTYYLEGIDRDRLKYTVITRYGTENYGNSLQCAMCIEHWYNHRSRSDYRYISNEIMPRR